MVQRVAPLTEVGRFARGGYGFTIATPAGLRGSVSMTRLLVCDFNRPFDTVFPFQIIWGNSNSVASNDGWRYLLGLSGIPEFQISDGAGTLRAAVSSYTLVSGARLLWWGSWDSTTMRIRVNGVEDSFATGGSGYTDSTQNYTLGGNPALSQAATSFGFATALGSDSIALDFAQMQAAEPAIIDALMNNRYITPAPGYDEAYLDARDIDFLNGTWTDRISGDVLTMSGTPEPQQRWAAL